MQKNNEDFRYYLSIGAKICAGFAATVGFLAAAAALIIAFQPKEDMPATPELIVWRGDRCDKSSETFRGDISDLRKAGGGGFLGGGNWQDEINSFRVVAGIWVFHEHINYGGWAKEFGPGSCQFVGDVGIPRKSISSIRLVAREQRRQQDVCGAFAPVCKLVLDAWFYTKSIFYWP